MMLSTFLSSVKFGVLDGFLELKKEKKVYIYTLIYPVTVLHKPKTKAKTI